MVTTATRLFDLFRDRTLSARSYHALSRHGCRTLGDVARLGRRRLAVVPYLGAKSRCEVNALLALMSIAGAPAEPAAGERPAAGAQTSADELR